jgi:NADH-quinone oxidoreductase subunit L
LTHPHHVELSHSLEWILMGLSVALVLVCALSAILIYRNGPEGGKKFANAFGGLYRLVLDKWRVDELYHLILVQPLAKVGQISFSIFHRYVIDGIVNGVPETMYAVTSVASDAQSGMTRNYLKLFFLGILLFAFILFS